MRFEFLSQKNVITAYVELGQVSICCCEQGKSSPKLSDFFKALSSGL